MHVGTGVSWYFVYPTPTVYDPLSSPGHMHDRNGQARLPMHAAV